MRRIVLTLTVASLLIAGAPLRAQELSFTFFGDYLESLRRQAGIPGLTAIIAGPDGVVWTRALGNANVERAVAARTDTPFHLDGITQVITAALVLRCVEEGRLSLADRAGQYDPASPDAGATLGQLLTHTTTGAGGRTFEYRPERLQPLAAAVAACTGGSFRAAVAALFDRLAMADSVPGVEAARTDLADPAIPTSDRQRYRNVLDRLASPYAVDRAGRATPAAHPSTALSAWNGVVSSADDLAKLDLALKRGVLLEPGTLASAWQPPLGPGGQPLPHGAGWFVQGYNGARVAWQFGMAENASSTLIATILPRGLTLILLANSDGLAKSFALADGDLTASPFGKVFLATFVR
ncbi:MAG: beta-lactamase family protein [Acidobacteria bacterium]|nr:beta-lactamase family protein [Acidobacteriota bacterium]